jgi:hypothetical protein
MHLLISPVYRNTCNCSLFFSFRVRVGMCLSPTFWWSMPHFSHCYKPSPLQAHWGRRCHIHLLWPAYLQCTRECLSPPLQWSFHTTSAVTNFPLSKVAGQVPPLLPSPAGLFIYSSCGECPSPVLWSSGHPTLFAMCLFFSAACLLFSLVFFLFFLPGWGLSRGLC